MAPSAAAARETSPVKRRGRGRQAKGDEQLIAPPEALNVAPVIDREISSERKSPSRRGQKDQLSTGPKTDASSGVSKSASGKQSSKSTSSSAATEFPYSLIPAFVRENSPLSPAVTLLSVVLILFAVFAYFSSAATLVFLPGLEEQFGSSLLSSFGLYSKLEPLQRHLYRVPCHHSVAKHHQQHSSNSYQHQNHNEGERFSETVAKVSSTPAAAPEPPLTTSTVAQAPVHTPPVTASSASSSSSGSCPHKKSSGSCSCAAEGCPACLANVPQATFSFHGALWRNETGTVLKSSQVRSLLSYRVSGHVLDLGHAASSGLDESWVYFGHLKLLIQGLIRSGVQASADASSRSAHSHSSSPLAAAESGPKSTVAPVKGAHTASKRGPAEAAADFFSSSFETVNSFVQSLLPRPGLVYTTLRNIPSNRQNRSILSIPKGVDVRPRTLNLTHPQNGNFSLPAKEFDFILMDFTLIAIRDEQQVNSLISQILGALKPGGRLLFIEPTSSERDTSSLVRFTQQYFMEPVCRLFNGGNCNLTRDVVKTLSRFAFESVHYVYLDEWSSPYWFGPITFGIATKESGSWILNHIF